MCVCIVCVCVCRVGKLAQKPEIAGAIGYIRCTGEVDTSALVEELRSNHDVLIVPGEHFGMKGYVRVGFGNSIEKLRNGLDALGAGFREVAFAG